MIRDLEHAPARVDTRGIRVVHLDPGIHMNRARALAPGTTVAIVGAGRLGGVLAGALAAAGLAVRGPIGRGDPVPAVDILLLCVPDAAIPDAAAAARPHAVKIAHCSGATGLADVDFSIHPLQTFTGSEQPEVFHGIGAAIDGRTADDRDTAQRLADALGAIPFPVDESHRAAYHAAASFASNFVLTVLDAAEQLARVAGVERVHLAPLVRQTVENWVAAGAAEALTGPIARGDVETVARQRSAVDEAAPHLTALFDQLAVATEAVIAGTPVSIPPTIHRATAEEEPRA